MQEYRQKRTESELQLWEINASGQRQASVRQNRRAVNQSQVPIRQNQTAIRQNQTAVRQRQAPVRQSQVPIRQIQTQTRSNGRPIQIRKRQRARRRQVIFYRCAILGIFVLFLIGVFRLTGIIYKSIHANKESKEVFALDEAEVQNEPETVNLIDKPLIKVDFLELNQYSRPGTELKKVKNIFVHYTANQGTSAAQNRSYFANLAKTGERSASAHFVIGYEGEIIQCIPLDEEAFAVIGRNDDSISIECCYLSEDGEFTQSTYNSLIKLLAWLCGEYELSEQDILRHYDEGGKKCPLYYVEHENEWDNLLSDVKLLLGNGALSGDMM